MSANKKLYRNVLLENILKMKQNTLKHYVSEHLKGLYEDVYVEDGFVYAKGSYPVLLVAHMDTVHSNTVKKIKYHGEVISSPQGIGGDDRCGVYIILELLKHFKCSVLFTEDEEIGGIGAGKFARSIYINECEVNFIVEFDRRGSTDAVFYRCDNPDFEEFIRSTDYFKTSWGSFSDISVIAPILGIAAVNLSSGYYKEHTKEETINLLEVQQIIEEAKKLLVKDVEKPFEYIEKEYFGRFGEDYHYHSRWYEDYIDLKGLLITKEKNLESHLYHIYFDPGYGDQICIEVYAINKMEALGIALTKMSYFSVADISGIYELPTLLTG